MMKTMRRGIERADGAAAPVVSEGGRSPSTLSTGLPGMMPNPSTIGPLGPGQRWSVARKREVVLRLLRGESVELLSRELGVRYRHSALRQQILDVTQAEGEPEVEPYCLVNDLGRETIAGVADLVHPRWATRPPRTPQAQSAVTMPFRPLVEKY